MKIKRFNILFVFVTSLTFILGSCKDDNYSPRPSGYFRIDMDSHEYQHSMTECEFGFEYSKYARLILKDKERCWYNIYYPKHKATIYLTYVNLNNDLKTHIDQTQKLTYEHQIKASKIDRLPIGFPEKKVFGLKYRLSGEVASSIQFYLTDSTDHYIRGSLYFDTYVNSDSLKPVIDYIDFEIQHLIESLTWGQDQSSKDQ
jgi:gliding motility-associated lipoprotein GldD